MKTTKCSRQGVPLCNYKKLPKRIKKHLHFLRTIVDCCCAKRKETIKRATMSQIKALAECAHNIRAGILPLMKKHKQRLRRYKGELKRLANYNYPTHKQKRKLSQVGGSFFRALLGPLGAAVNQGQFRGGI
jgi:hypothetical protein